MATDDLTRDELRLALKPTNEITLMQALYVGDMIMKAKRPGFIWVPPHVQEGHPVKGYWRTNPHPARTIRDVFRSSVTTDMKHGITSGTAIHFASHVPETPAQAARLTDTAHAAEVAGRKAKSREYSSRLRRAERTVDVRVDSKVTTGAIERKNKKTLAALDRQLKEALGWPDTREDKASQIRSLQRQIAVLRPGEAEPESAKNAHVGPQKIVEREMLRRNARRKTPTTFGDLYRNPPGLRTKDHLGNQIAPVVIPAKDATDDEKRTFRTLMFESLMERPYHAPADGGKRTVVFPTLSKYLEFRLSQATASTDPGTPSDAAKDAMGETLLSVFGRFVNGDLQDKLDNPNAGTNDPHSMSDVQLAFGRMMGGTFRANFRSPARRRRAMGLPSNKSVKEKETQRDIALQSLDVENQGIEALATEAGQGLLPQFDPEVEALIVIAAVGQTDGGFRTNAAKKLILDSMGRLLPPTLKVEVSDPADRSKALVVEVNPYDAVVSSKLMTIDHEKGRTEKLPSLTYVQTAVLLADAVYAKPYHRKAPGDARIHGETMIGLKPDNAAVAEALGITEARVGIERRKAQALIFKRIQAQALDDIKMQRMNYVPKPKDEYVPPTGYDLWEEGERKNEALFNPLFRRLQAQVGAGETAPLVQLFRQKKITVVDMVREYNNQKRMAAERVTVPDVIPVEVPDIKPVKPTVRSHQLGVEDQARRDARAAQMQLQRQYDADMAQHRRWSEKVDDAQRHVERLKTALANESAQDRGIEWVKEPGKRKKTARRFSPSAQRLAAAEKELADLKANPHPKPKKPRDKKVSGIPIHVHEAAPPRTTTATTVKPVAVPSTRKRRPVSAKVREKHIAEMRRAADAQAAAAKEQRLAEMKQTKMKVDGQEVTLTVEPRGDSVHVLRIRDGKKTLLFAQTFDDGVVGQGKSKAAAIARMKDIKRSKAIPVESEIAVPWGRVVTPSALEQRAKGNRNKEDMVLLRRLGIRKAS